MPPAAALRSETLDPGLVRLIEALAREAMQNFYADGTGWDDEQLVATDISPITWRKLASRWNRGIARPGKGVDGSVKTHSIRLKKTAEGKPPGYFVEQIED